MQSFYFIHEIQREPTWIVDVRAKSSSKKYKLLGATLLFKICIN